MRTHTINPTRLSATDARILGAFLAAHPKDKEFSTNQSYKIKSQGVWHSFKLTDNLTRFKDDKGMPLFAVYGKTQLGLGTFGQVYQTEGFIKVTNDSGANFTPKVMAIKRLGKSVNYEDIKGEQRHTPSHLGMQKPTRLKEGAAIVMDRLPGVELRKILEDEANPLSLAEKVELTGILLQKLQEQVHLHGKVHRDLKPENILVDRNTRPMTVNIIDFGTAKAISELKDDSPGTRGYIPPEGKWTAAITMRQDDYQWDVFSLGVIIGEMINLKPTFPPADFDPERRVGLRDYQRWCADPDYTNHPGLADSPAQKLLADLATNMTRANLLPADGATRFTLPQAQEHFKSLLTEDAIKVLNVPLPNLSLTTPATRERDHLIQTCNQLADECLIASSRLDLDPKLLRQFIQEKKALILENHDDPAALEKIRVGLSNEGTLSTAVHCQALLRTLQTLHAKSRGDQLLGAYVEQQAAALKQASTPAELATLAQQMRTTLMSITSKEVQLVHKVIDHMRSNSHIFASAAKAKAEKIENALWNIPLDDRRNAVRDDSSTALHDALNTQRLPVKRTESTSFALYKATLEKIKSENPLDKTEKTEKEEYTRVPSPSRFM